MRRFELTDSDSNKFWQIEVNGSDTTVHFGKIGTKGQVQIKSFPSSSAASAAAAKLISEKLAKGYVEVGGGAESTPPAPASPRVKGKPKAEKVAKAAPSEVDKAQIERILRKAKAAETSSFDIRRVVIEACGANAPDAPAKAARVLQDLFAKKRLTVTHDDALDVFGLLFGDTFSLRFLTASERVNSDQHDAVPIDLLDVGLVVRLLGEINRPCRGLEALTLVAYRQAPARLLEARAEASPAGCAILDSVRLRAGESLPDADRDAALDWLASSSPPMLITKDGHVQIYGRTDAWPPSVFSEVDIERAMSQVPPKAWTAALARYSVGGGSMWSVTLLHRFDEDQLVQIAMSNPSEFNSDDTLSELLRLELRAAPLWAALERWRAEHPWEWAKEDDCLRTLLACHGALASAREKREVPATFEAMFGVIEHGLPGFQQSGLETVVDFIVRALRTLPAKRVAKLGHAALTKGAEEETNFYDADAILAAVVSQDRKLLALVADKIADAPPAVQRVAGVVQPASEESTMSSDEPPPVASPSLTDDQWQAIRRGAKLGALDVPSGEVVVCDPATFATPTHVSLAARRLAVHVADSGAALLVPGAKPRTFEHAGYYGVDTGTTGFFDAGTFANVKSEVFENNIYEDLLEPRLERAPAALVPFGKARFVACKTKDGDGVYPVFAGKDASGSVVAIVTTF